MSLKSLLKSITPPTEVKKQIPQSLKGLLKSITPATEAPVKKQMPYAVLINAESAFGRTIFGPIPAGHHREFFEQEKNVWIWHEDWEEQGVHKEATIRYEVRPNGVFKRPLGSGYTRIYGDELENFRLAAHAYLDIIKRELYKK